MIYRTICKELDALNKITDASECFRDMMHELGGETNLPTEQAEWAAGERFYMRKSLALTIFLSGFKHDLSHKLEFLGDAALHSRQYHEAISAYSIALSLDLASPQGFFIKRSKAYVAQAQAVKDESLEQAHSTAESVSQSSIPSLRRIRRLWEKALNDANKVRPSLSRRLVLILTSSFH